MKEWKKIIKFREFNEYWMQHKICQGDVQNILTPALFASHSDVWDLVIKPKEKKKFDARKKPPFVFVVNALRLIL